MTVLLALEAVDSGRVSLDEMIVAQDDCLEGLEEDSSTSGIAPGIVDVEATWGHGIQFRLGRCELSRTVFISSCSIRIGGFSLFQDPTVVFQGLLPLFQGFETVVVPFMARIPCLTGFLQRIITVSISIHDDRCQGVQTGSLLIRVKALCRPVLHLVGLLQHLVGHHAAVVDESQYGFR